MVRETKKLYHKGKALLDALVKYDHTTGSYNDYEEIILSAGIKWDDFNEARIQYEQDLHRRKK